MRSRVDSVARNRDGLSVRPTAARRPAFAGRNGLQANSRRKGREMRPSQPAFPTTMSTPLTGERIATARRPVTTAMGERPFHAPIAMGKIAYLPRARILDDDCAGILAIAKRRSARGRRKPRLQVEATPVKAIVLPTEKKG